jgi:hypothetical protein
MTTLNHTQLKILTLVSFICLLIPSSILGLWIYVCARNVGTPQPEIVAIFKDYFPDFLHGRWGTTLISMIFCVSSIVLSGFSMKLTDKLWKVINTIIVSMSSIMLFFNLWSMM